MLGMGSVTNVKAVSLALVVFSIIFYRGRFFPSSIPMIEVFTVLKWDSNFVRDLYGKVIDSATTLFLKKNAEYGCAFMKYSRLSLYIDLKRKWLRFNNLFNEDENKIEFIGENKKHILVSSLIDLLNYCAIFIVRELIFNCKDAGEMERNLTDLKNGNEISYNENEKGI